MLKRVAAWIGFWTVLGLGFTTQVYLGEQRLGAQAPTWWVALFGNLPEWYLWGLVSMLIVVLVRRFPVDRTGWRRHFPLHLGVSLNIAFLHLIAAVLIQSAVAVEGVPIVVRLVDNFSVQYHWNLVVYWGILGFAHAREYHRDREEHRVRAAQLEARLAQARLQALTLELRPHFLFNALNAIAELVHEDPDAAERMVQGLGDLLRRTMETNGAEEVALDRELDLAAGYLRIEGVRFHDRLLVEYDVAAEARRARVPPMILLPLVENAVRHGLARRGQGRVGIRARRLAEQLELEVWDDGEGLVEGLDTERRGIGLDNTRERLRQMYGSVSTLELVTREPRGVTARVTVPFSA